MGHLLEWSAAPRRRTHPHRHVSQGEQLGRSGYVGVVLVLAAVLISYYSAETDAGDALADAAPEEYDTVRRSTWRSCYRDSIAMRWTHAGGGCARAGAWGVRESADALACYTH